MTTQRWLVYLYMGVFIAVAIGSQAEANVQQMKFYKEAHEGTKPNCLICHIDKLPKKDDGMHDLNAYGLKVKSASEEPTVETYKSVGSAEDFTQDESSGGADKKVGCDDGSEGCEDKQEKTE